MVFKRGKDEKGFALLEILTVMFIIGLLLVLIFMLVDRTFLIDETTSKDSEMVRSENNIKIWLNKDLTENFVRDVYVEELESGSEVLVIEVKDLEEDDVGERREIRYLNRNTSEGLFLERSDGEMSSIIAPYEMKKVDVSDDGIISITVNVDLFDKTIKVKR